MKASLSQSTISKHYSIFLTLTVFWNVYAMSRIRCVWLNEPRVNCMGDNVGGKTKVVRKSFCYSPKTNWEEKIGEQNPWLRAKRFETQSKMLKVHHMCHARSWNRRKNHGMMSKSDTEFIIIKIREVSVFSQLCSKTIWKSNEVFTGMSMTEMPSVWFKLYDRWWRVSDVFSGFTFHLVELDVFLISSLILRILSHE